MNVQDGFIRFHSTVEGAHYERARATDTSSASKRSPRLSVLRIASVSLCALVMGFAMLATAAPASAQVAIGVSVSFAPPPLPVYTQPICPGPGYIWTPGYWAYDPDGGYYWVPGTWVLAPEPGLLWTPGYWGWGGVAFIWHPGYWGPRVGFYGGINYGFGYFGVGYQGGYWNNGRFFYNRAVNNISTTKITNVYNKTVINNVTVHRVSYNGGHGGITAGPTAAELAAANERHVAATSGQVRHAQAARSNRALFASANHGRPPIAATPKPGAFKGRGVVRASRAGAPYHPETQHAPATHERATAARTPNAAGGGTRPLIAAHPNPSAQGTSRHNPPPHAGAPAARPTYNASQHHNTPPPSSKPRTQGVPHVPTSYHHAPQPPRRHTEEPAAPRASRPQVQHEAVPHAAPQHRRVPQLQPRQEASPHHPEKRPPE